MRMAKGEAFMHVMDDGEEHRVFSEGFLYERVGKGDARFILGVAGEYAHVIDALGEDVVRVILETRPRLVRRLGTGEKIKEWLADARSEDSLNREAYAGGPARLDGDAARAVWQMLHDEYKAYFDVASMDADRLAAYNRMTDDLGPYMREERKKADEGRQAMADRAKPRQAARRARDKAQRDVVRAVLAGEGVPEELMAELRLAHRSYEDSFGSRARIPPAGDPM